LVQRVEVETAKPEFHDYVNSGPMIVNRHPDTLYVAVRECRLDLLTRASLIRAGGPRCAADREKAAYSRLIEICF